MGDDLEWKGKNNRETVMFQHISFSEFISACYICKLLLLVITAHGNMYTYNLHF